MKRLMLGVTALSLLGGVGSLGAYYGRDLLARQSAEPSLAEPESPLVSDVRAATPIPLSSEPAAVANPFTQPQKAQRVAVSDDRYAADETQPAEEPEAEPIATRPRQQPHEDAIPATPSADPLGLRRRPDPRHEEPQEAAEPNEDKTAEAAEEPAEQSREEEPATEPTEQAVVEDSDEPAPRPLTRAAAPAVDRYGRAKPTATQAQYKEVPAEPAAEDLPAITPVEAPREEPPVEPANEQADDTGTGRPGDPQLSGSQAPTLTIEKTAPAEIQIGKPAKFVIKVRNAGSVAAHGVQVHDSIPQGTQFIDAKPLPSRGAQGALIWDLGTLKPGDEQTAELQLMPQVEGEVGSVATVHFRAEASVRTMATKPMLTMDVVAPSKVMKGEEVLLKIKLSNPGSGAATGIVLSENVPPALKHPAGTELELDVGTLKPGESRELELSLTAAEAGPVSNMLKAQGDGSLLAEAQADVEVLAPQLQVSLAGPKRRYLERNATHNISVSNPGTAAAKDIELVAVLPKELKFVEANNGGQFDPATHAVYWSLEELPPQETGTVTLTTLPLTAGEAKLTIKSTAQSGLTDQREESVAIEGLAAINFQLGDTSDPIEAGGQTSYEVKVTNQGSKAAANVRLVALVPREMKAVSAEGPVRYKIEAGRVVFEPLKQLAPKAETKFTIKVQAAQAGDLRLQVQLTTDEIREPITKEESTRVYENE